mgnify:CR=1 FL=1
MEAEYTLRVRNYPGRREVRFWLETTRPHEIDDAIVLLTADPLFDLVVTQQFPASDAVHAFEVAADSSISSKVVLTLWGSDEGTG